MFQVVLAQLSAQQAYVDKLLSNRSIGIKNVANLLSKNVPGERDCLIDIVYHAIMPLYKFTKFLQNKEQDFELTKLERPSNLNEIEMIKHAYTTLINEVNKTSEQVGNLWEEEGQDPFNQGNIINYGNLFSILVMHLIHHLGQVVRIQKILGDIA